MKYVIFLKFEMIDILLWDAVETLCHFQCLVSLLIARGFMAYSELGPFYEFGANTNRCCDTNSTVNHSDEVKAEKGSLGPPD